MRFMDEMREQRDNAWILSEVLRSIGPEGIASVEVLPDLEGDLGSDWLVVPWFVENAWFFES